MKFGVELQNALFPLWRAYYVDYSMLKKLLDDVVDGYPYMDLFSKFDVHVENDPAEPFKLLICGVTLESIRADGGKETVALRVDTVRGESGTESTGEGANTPGASPVGPSSDSPQLMTSFVAKMSSSRVVATSTPTGWAHILTLDSASAALLSKDATLSLTIAPEGFLNMESVGYCEAEAPIDIAHSTIAAAVSQASQAAGRAMHILPSTSKGQSPRASIADQSHHEQILSSSSARKKNHKLSVTERHHTMRFFISSAFVGVYRNPSIAHALFMYQCTVSAVLSKAIQSELEKVSNFYVSQSHLLCQSALLCVDAMKMWSSLSVKEKNQLRIVYRQTYLTLDVLQQFCDLNCVAIGKILKKMDKNTHQNMLEAYKTSIEHLDFRMGRNSRIHTLQKIMLDRYAKHAAQGKLKEAHAFIDSREASNAGRDSVSTLASLAGAIGVVVSLSALIIVELRTAEESSRRFPLGSAADLFGSYLALLPLLFILLPVLFSINVMTWEHFGINFAFMFELDPIFHWSGAELLRDALLYVIIWCICVLAFLRQNFNDVHCLKDGVPFDEFSWGSTAPLFSIFPIWVVMFAGRAYYNKKVFSRPSWLANTVRRILCTPFASVKFSDFFLADQLTSLAGPLFELQFYWCTFSFSSDVQHTCSEGRHASVCFLSILPNLWRFLQCLRRFRDQSKASRKPFPNLINAGKYCSSIVEVLVWMIYSIVSLKKSDEGVVKTFFAFGVLASIISQAYKFIWDIVVDAGIWIDNGEGYRLREDRVYQSWTPYMIFIAEDFILRSVWFIKLFVNSALKGEGWAFAMWSIIEIFRRFFWNFFRIENEHVNNTESYRATKLAPIPQKRIQVWDSIATDDVSERFIKNRDKQSSEFPSIRGVNLTTITRYFALLPEEEKLKIIQNHPLCTARAKFNGVKNEGKSKFFSELPEESKVVIILDHIGDATMLEYETRLSRAHPETESLKVSPAPEREHAVSPQQDTEMKPIDQSTAVK